MPRGVACRRHNLEATRTRRILPSTQGRAAGGVRTMSFAQRFPHPGILIGAALQHRLARAVTEVFAPVPTVAALLVVMAWHTAATTADAVRWGLVAVVFASASAFAY